MDMVFLLELSKNTFLQLLLWIIPEERMYKT